MDDRDTEQASAPPPGDGAPTASDSAATNEVETLRRQLDEKQDRLLRALAEAENVRRRLERTADERVRYANESLLHDVVPVLDNFDRALAARYLPATELDPDWARTTGQFGYFWIPVVIQGRIRGIAAVPDEPGYPDGLVEVASHTHLRTALGLEDGDPVTLTAAAPRR